MIKLGDLDFTSIKQGSTDIVAVYLADEMIWGGSQPTTSGGVVTLTLTGGTTSSVTYSDGVIPQRAFRQNSAITMVEIESGITQIGQSAFAYCSAITDVEIGENVTSIGGDAFYYCTALSSVSIPNSVTTIGDEAFMSCNSLSSLTIGNGVTSIGDYALQSYHLSSITCNAVTAPSLGTSVFATLPAVGTLYVPYGSDYSSWIGTGATSSNQLASGWTISYIMPTLGAYEIRAKMSDDSIVTVTSTTATIGDTNSHFTETSYLGDYFPVEEENIVEIEFGSSIYGFGEIAFLSCSSLEYIRIHSLSPEFYSGYDPMWGQSGNGLLVFSMDLPVNYEVTYFDGDMPEGWEIRYIFERDVVITNSSQSNGVVSLTYNDEDMTMPLLNEGESTTISAGTLFVGDSNVGKGGGQDVIVYAVPQPDAFSSTFNSINVSGVTSESLMQSGFNPTSNEFGNSVLMYGVSAITFNVQYTYEGEPED